MTDETKSKVKSIILKYLNSETPVDAYSVMIYYKGGIRLHVYDYSILNPDDTILKGKHQIDLEIDNLETSQTRVFTLLDADFTKIEWAQILTKFEELNKQYEETLLNKLSLEGVIE